jgi:hypothetical protein
MITIMTMMIAAMATIMTTTVMIVAMDKPYVTTPSLLGSLAGAIHFVHGQARIYGK